MIVETVSWMSVFSREQVVMMLVRHPPESESLRILVSLELRYGTCSADVVSADTTLPRQERERLIFLVY